MKSSTDIENGRSNLNLNNMMNMNMNMMNNQSEHSTLISLADEKIDINIKKRKLGRMKCFYYVNGEPVIVIGPHCKILF